MSLTLFLLFFPLLLGYQFFFKGILEGWQQRICEAAWLHTEWGERGSRILQCCSGPWLALLVWLGFSPGAFICPPEIRDYFKLTQMDRINHTWFYFSLLQHNYLLSPPPSRPSPLSFSLPFSLSRSPPTPLSGLQTEEMHKFRCISIPVRLTISRQGLAPFRLSSSCFSPPSLSSTILNHLSGAAFVGLLIFKPFLNYF